MLGPFATASRRTPIHQVSLPVLSHADCASMSTTTTTTTTTRDRGYRYGPMEWAQWAGPRMILAWVGLVMRGVATTFVCSWTWSGRRSARRSYRASSCAVNWPTPVNVASTRPSAASLSSFILTTAGSRTTTTTTTTTTPASPPPSASSTNVRPRTCCCCCCCCHRADVSNKCMLYNCLEWYKWA